MMVSLLEDNSLGDTSLNPYLHILNNGDGIGQGRVNDDMGNVTIEHVDTSKISPDEFLLDKNIFTQDQDRLEIGIEAGDVNSLLEQFEESEASQTDHANEVTHVPLNTTCSSKKNADSDLKKSDMSIEAIAKKIAPVKRKSTILLENVTLPLKRNRKPLNHVAFKTTSSQPCSHPCSNPNSLPNSAPNSLPASLPSSCNSSRSCSPVHQWTVPSMDHDYCYTPNVYLPMSSISPSSPKCVNKENGAISDLTTEKKEEKRNELYMGKYKIKKKNHHRHHHHHHRHHRHSHQDMSKTMLDAGIMMNSNSLSPALIGSVHREFDISQRAREEFQKRFGKLEVPVIPEKKTLKIQSLNEPPLMNLRKKVDHPDPQPALSNNKKKFQPEGVGSGEKNETNQNEESKSHSLSTESCSENKSVIKIEQENGKSKPLSANEIHLTDAMEIRKSVKQEKMSVYSVDDQENLMTATAYNSQKRLTPAINSRDQGTSINEVNEAGPVVSNLEDNMVTPQVDKTDEIYPSEDIHKALESQCDTTSEQKLQVQASVGFTESINTNIKCCVDKISMDIDVEKNNNVNHLEGEINRLLKGCGQKYDERDLGNGEYLTKCKEPEVAPEDEDSGEIESSDDVNNKDDDDMHRWRERSYSPYRKGRSSSRSSDRSSQWSRSKSQSFRKCRSRSHSYESSRSRSRSNSYRSRRGHRRRRRRYRRSSHSSCSMSSRSSSRGSRGSRRSRTRSSSCSTCPSRSYSRSRSRSISRSHSRSRSRRSRGRSRSRSSRRRSGRRHSSDRKRRYLRDRSVSRERRLEMKKRQEQEWEDRRVLYVGNISEGTTRRDISYRFSKFGDITRITLHFRDKGDNYCFVTFAYTCDAYAAVEFGNEDPSFPKYEICFGGRRNFCRTSYADLDNMHREEEELKYGYNGSVEPTRTRSSSKETDFDALLKQALKKIKHR